jgi:hypothetical protein
LEENSEGELDGEETEEEELDEEMVIEGDEEMLVDWWWMNSTSLCYFIVDVLEIFLKGFYARPLID